MGLGSEDRSQLLLAGGGGGVRPLLSDALTPRVPKARSTCHRWPSRHPQRSPGSYEVILFLLILGKNSKYKIILIKVKIHYLDFVVSKQ